MSEFSIRTQPFRLGLADYCALWLSPRAVLSGLFFYVFLAVFASLALGLLDGDIRTCLYGAAAALAYGLVSYGTCLLMLWLRYRRDPVMTGERLMVLDSGAVRLVGDGCDIRQTWEAFSRIHQGRDHIFLHMRNYAVYVIPKRALSALGESRRLITVASAAIRSTRNMRSELMPLPEAPDTRETWLSLPYRTRPYFHGERVFRFTRDYVRCTTAAYDARFDWQNVRGVRQAPGVFIFRLASGRFRVPASAFATPAQAMAFYTQAVAFWRAAEVRR